MTHALILTGVLLVAQTASPPAPSEAIDAIRGLYASASYEEALFRISALEERYDPNELDQYRALCLIGLGRVSEAEQALERIIHRSPLFKIDEGLASPSVLARYATVRHRVLPLAASRMYSRAKTSFDLKDFDATAAQLHELITVLRKESTSGNQALAEIHQLAEGFLRLTEAQLAASTRTVFSSLDRDVTPPIEIERKLPAWDPPNDHEWRWFRGVVQVLVDEHGAVQHAQLLEPIAEFYDARLLQAARQWRFAPATREGQPVKYRKLVEITIRTY
jgi:TonB family protein